MTTLKLKVETETPKTLQIDGSFVEKTMESDYSKLENKPQINSVTLDGNLSSEDLKLQDAMSAMTGQSIDQIIYGS